MSKKRTMWWNLPPEEIDELREQGQLKSFTCVEYDENEIIEKERKKQCQE